MTNRSNTFILDEVGTMPQVQSLVDMLRPLQEENNHYIMWREVRGTDPMPNPNIAELNWGIRREKLTAKEILRRYGNILTDHQKQSLIAEEKRKKDAVKKCNISKKDFRDLGFYLGFDVWGGYAYLSKEQIIREAKFLVEEIKVEHESRYVYSIESKTVRDRLLNRTGYIKNAEELSRFLQGTEFPYNGPKVRGNKGLYHYMQNGNRIFYKDSSISNREIVVLTGRSGMEELSKAMKRDAVETVSAHALEEERKNLYTMKQLNNNMPLMNLKDLEEPVRINSNEDRFTWECPITPSAITEVINE